jgi:transposase
MAMFIRKTRIINQATKKAYWNFQLVESIRTERGPRQRILLNLGADLNLSDPERKELANRIEEILKGIITFIPCSEKIESYAQKFASLLKEEAFSVSAKEKKSDKQTDLQVIDLETIEQQEARTVGGEHLLLYQARQLRLPQKLKQLGLSDKEIALGLGTIIGRAVFPASERATHEWLCRRSGLGELLDFDFQSTNLDQLYYISDTLFKHKAELEEHLEQAQQATHGLQSTMVLYDLTNTYMEGRAKGNPKAKHGVSKEKRFDCPLVTLGLVVNEHGFVTRSAFLPGNIGEPTTLQQAIQQLGPQDSLFKPIIVLDAGIASEDNLAWLRKHQYPYVVSARQKAPDMELSDELISVGAKTSEVRVAFIKSTEGEEEQWLYCESEAKEAVASQMKARYRERFETDLKKLVEGVQKPLGRKLYTKVLERIGRLKEKHKAISGCYEITAHLAPDGLKTALVTWEVKPEKMEDKLRGHYFLRTNLKETDPQKIWHLYGSLRVVEDSFRFMKSALGMRPVYHQKDKRVDAHLWITILAYHLIKSCMHQLQKNGINDRWETIRNTLSTRIRVTMQAMTGDGKVLHHRSTTKAEIHQLKIYQALGISPQILKAKKTIL